LAPALWRGQVRSSSSGCGSGGGGAGGAGGAGKAGDGAEAEGADGRPRRGDDGERETEELRPPPEGGQRVTFAELFFDLVYVVAVTQLASRLVDHLTLQGAAETLLLALAVWWAWVSTAWFTNWFDPEDRRVRTVLVLLMMASLILTAAIPEALGDRGAWFACAYVAIQCGRTGYSVLALRRRSAADANDEATERLRRDQERALVWALGAGALWIAGGLAIGMPRVVLWIAALVVDYVAPAVGFRTPGLGRSTTSDWAIEGSHLAERCQLFLIVAFGESVLSTGATFADDEPTALTVASLTVAFAGNVALWWVYFDRHAGRATATIGDHHDPGRLGRSAYTYLHFPMVAGIIVTAVGDELVLTAPGGTTSVAAGLTVLGGPALFLVGHALFKLAVFGIVSGPRLVAAATLLVLVAGARHAPPLAVSLVATLVIAGVAVVDLRRPPPLGTADELAGVDQTIEPDGAK
jgi:low temperature requirement protein LtrA